MRGQTPWHLQHYGAGYIYVVGGLQQGSFGAGSRVSGLVLVVVLVVVVVVVMVVMVASVLKAKKG